MGSQDGGQDGKKPAEGTAPEVKPSRTLKVAELRAAADRARSEVPEATEAPTKTDGADGAKPGEKASPETEPVKPYVPQKAEEGKPLAGGAEIDPKAGPDNPFWKTQLGRYIREKEAQTDATIAELQATITLLKKPGKEPPVKAAPSEPQDDLERELADAEKDPADKNATEGKPGGDKPPVDQGERQAVYTKTYLANNSNEEYSKNPMFGEVQALMFNRHDPQNTFNRAWSGEPDADYRINFRNAEVHLLQKKISDTATPDRPGEKNLKGETPSASLGVGGDVKNADGRQSKPIALDDAAQRYLAHIKRKGRDPEKVMKRAFAVDLGAGRSAAR